MTSHSITTIFQGMKSLNNNQIAMLKACISEEERKKARDISKAQGYTFQGWLGQVIKREISKEASNDD